MSGASRFGLVASLMLAGCFDSLVSNPCASGYQLVGGTCVVHESEPDADPAPDSGPGQDAASSDGGLVDAPVGLVCTLPEIECSGGCLDVSSDPDNCGACDRVCASGICQAGHCLGTLSGHIIAIGHDYQSHHAAMRTVLGNSIALGAHPDVAVARWHGSSSEASSTGTTLAINLSMASLGRPWHPVALAATPSTTALADADVLVIEAQTGDGVAARASAVPWASAIDGFLQRGGVVVVLEGVSGVSYQVADGAGLFSIAPPVDSTGLVALVSDGSDAIAQQVVSPYLAELSSVVFPGVVGAIVTPNGTLAFHQTRY
ncbi:MAG: Tryptophan synthase alpha chain [Deltaproteobacteria bacterium]|nr:Tryptophan synthase alpha chain [Deltaproteobacteria bacterium]